MGLFQGEAPPNVQTTRETAAVAPQYLTDYLTQLAQQGQQALGTKDPVTGAYTAPTQAALTTAGTPYVAPLSQLQKLSQGRALRLQIELQPESQEHTFRYESAL